MSANVSVKNFPPATGASSIKKFEEGLSSTSFSSSDGSAKTIILLNWTL
jgi:hypothetical protein